jgi:hypothetical protein
MARKLVIDLPDGTRQLLAEVLADDELQLQEQLKLHPGLLLLEELGLVGPAVVVGRESALDSGRVDLVLLGNGGDLALVEFKTGLQNPDFRECLAPMLDYGSDLWGMTLEEFETRVAQRYFSGPRCPPGTIAPDASLDQVLSQAWRTTVDDAVDWREHLRAQLRDGSFQYVAAAQRFTPPVLRTLRYLNEPRSASDLDDLDIEHRVVIRILGHDRNTMGDSRGRDPAVVDRHLPAGRTKPRDQERPGLGDRLIHGQRLEPLSKLVGRQPPGCGLRVLGLQDAEPQLTQRDRRDTPLKIGEPAGIESRRLQADEH